MLAGPFAKPLRAFRDRATSIGKKLVRRSTGSGTATCAAGANSPGRRGEGPAVTDPAATPRPADPGLQDGSIYARGCTLDLSFL